MDGEQTGPMLKLLAVFVALAGVAAFVFLNESKPAAPASATPTTSAPPKTATPPASAPAPAAAPAVTPPPAASPAPQATDAWAECAVDLPDGAGRLVFRVKPSPEKPGAQLREIRIEAPAPGASVTLPSFPDAAMRVNVHWYPREAERGPFVRLQDREGDYLMTLGHKTLARLLRIKGGTYAGAFVDGEGGYGWTEGADGKIEATISGKKAYRIQGRLAETPGQYLGRVEGAGSSLRYVGGGEAEEPERNR